MSKNKIQVIHGYGLLVKNAITGICHVINENILLSNLAEFCCRYNRRFQLQDMFSWPTCTACTAVIIQPIHVQLMWITEDHG
jgi:hypothetical protein